MAMGALHSLEASADESLPDEYLNWAKLCLAKADFMTNNTIVGVQCLVCFPAIVKGN